MPICRDAQGQRLTAASPESARRLDETVAAYLGARADTRERLSVVLSNDPDCVLAGCLDGYLFMLASRRDAVREAREAVIRAKAQAQRESVTHREELHLAALEAWSGGDLRGAAGHWDALLADHPRDVLAIRVSQFVFSYLGE